MSTVTSSKSALAQLLKVPVLPALFVRTFVVLFTVAFCFLLMEFGLSLYYAEQQSGNWTKFDSLRGWSLVAGEYLVKPVRQFNAFTVYIDGFGLRSHRPKGGPTNPRRLVVLGDSFTFAKDTRIEDTFPERLQKLLSQRAAGIEVLNAGVPGYGTAQELLFTRELSQRYGLNADLYLVMFFTNDILDNLCLSYGNLTFEPVRPCFTLDEASRPVLTRLPENLPNYEDDTLVTTGGAGRSFKTIVVAKGFAEEWLQTKPSLVQILSRLGIRPQVFRYPGLLNGWYRDEILAKGEPLTASLIRQMQREVREKGGQLLVSMVPSPFQVYPETYVPLLHRSFPGSPVVDQFEADILRPQRLVREMCLKAGIPFQDLYPVLFKNRDSSLFIPREGHLTLLGHGLVAETLLPFVQDSVAKNKAEPPAQVSNLVR